MAFVDNAYNGRVIKEGLMPFKITLDDICDVGDLIGYDAIVGGDDAWELADADGKIPACFVAGEQCKTTGDEITCFKMAYIDFGSGSDADPGDMVYLSNTPGSYAATPGSWIHQCVGQCVSATMAFVNPSSQPLTAISTTGTGYCHIRNELGPLRVEGQYFGALRIDTKVIDTAVIATPQDINGLWVTHQLQDTECEGLGTILRLEDNSSTNCGCESFIGFHGGGDDSPDYLFSFSPAEATGGAWDHDATAKTTSSGWLKINFGGTTRYINMYSG